ncbi:unnamed protein product, partial [Trichogramma brassicae]
MINVCIPIVSSWAISLDSILSDSHRCTRTIRLLALRRNEPARANQAFQASRSTARRRIPRNSFPQVKYNAMYWLTVVGNKFVVCYINFEALVPVLLAASCQAGELLAQAAAEPLQQFTQSQNTATGEYGFSYSGGPSAKTEYRALDGTTTGTYSYVDANGQLQSVSYIADEAGFRATGTNIPQARKKRGILYQPTAFAAALPAASSSQNRFQIHNDARLIQRTEIHAPIYQAAVAAAAPVALHHAPAALLYRKKRGILAAAEPLPLAYAAAPALPLPPSSAKIYNEFNQQRPTLYAAAAPAPALVHAAPAAVAPIVHAAPAAPIIEQAPISRSSQNRFQVHKNSKIIEEIHTPLYPALQYAAYAAPALALQPAQPQLIQQQQHHFIGAAPQPAFGIGTVTAVGAPPSQPLPAGPIAAEPARPAPAPAAPAAVSDDAITVETSIRRFSVINRLSGVRCRIVVIIHWIINFEPLEVIRRLRDADRALVCTMYACACLHCTATSSIHEGRKDFACDKCEKKFGQKWILLQHQKTVHEGRKDYACDKCEKKFGFKSHLLSHHNTIHEGRKDFAWVRSNDACTCRKSGSAATRRRGAMTQMIVVVTARHSRAHAWDRKKGSLYIILILYAAAAAAQDLERRPIGQMPKIHVANQIARIYPSAHRTSQFIHSARLARYTCLYITPCASCIKLIEAVASLNISLFTIARRGGTKQQQQQRRDKSRQQRQQQQQQGFDSARTLPLLLLLLSPLAAITASAAAAAAAAAASSSGKSVVEGWPIKTTMTRRGKSSLPSGTQYLSQDPVSGAYQYGYSGPHHAKSESSYNGITRGALCRRLNSLLVYSRGDPVIVMAPWRCLPLYRRLLIYSYSYVDANGLLQTVSYTADAENGFRVRASNLPSSQLPEQQQHQRQPALRDAPEIALAKRRHLEQLHYAETRRAGSAWKAAYELEQQQQQQPSRRSYEQSSQKQTFGRRRSASSAAAFVARPPTSVSRPEARRISGPSQQQYHHQQQPQHYFYSSPTQVVAMSPSHMFHHGHRYVLSSAASEMPAYVPLPMPVIHGAASHTQDALGQYEYSYTGDTSAKIESRSMDGSTRGAYSYIDANGLLQQVRYVADKDGFR